MHFNIFFQQIKSECILFYSDRINCSQSRSIEFRSREYAVVKCFACFVTAVLHPIVCTSISDVESL